MNPRKPKPTPLEDLENACHRLSVDLRQYRNCLRHGEDTKKSLTAANIHIRRVEKHVAAAKEQLRVISPWWEERT